MRAFKMNGSFADGSPATIGIDDSIDPGALQVVDMNSATSAASLASINLLLVDIKAELVALNASINAGITVSIG